MIRTAKALFCDEEHGFGDVSFPEHPVVSVETDMLTLKELRRQAKKAGWKRIMGADYCPNCAESIESHRREKS